MNQYIANNIHKWLESWERNTMVICKDCRYHKSETYITKCKKTVRSINPVTGVKDLAPCIDINSRGDCKLWEASLLYIFKQVMKTVLNYFDLNKRRNK